MNKDALRRAGRRAVRALFALLVGALTAWLASPEFREFVDGLPYGALLLALVPPAVQALGKLRRDLKA